MNIRGAIFDLDGTLTDSMYIWQKAPVDLVRRYGGDPPEDLARDLKEMGRREAAEYLRSRFSLSTTPEELMDTLNDLVTEEYRSRVPMKPGADRLLEVEFPERWLSLLPEDRRQAAAGVLAQDPRPSYQRDPERIYGMEFAGWEIRFQVRGERLTVVEVKEKG